MLPEVKETSLSLSFDEQAPAEHSEQGFVNQQILPHPKHHMKQIKPQNQPGKRLQHDQENDQNAELQENSSPVVVKGREKLKQGRSKTVPQNCPSREPLKQILPPNEIHARGNNPKQDHLTQKPPHRQRTTGHVSKQRGSCLGHNSQDRLHRVFVDHRTAQPKGNVKQSSVKGPNVMHGADQRKDTQNDPKASNPQARPKPQSSEGVESSAFQISPRQTTSSKSHSEENWGRQVKQQQFVRQMDYNEFPPPENQVEKHLLETVYEGGTPDGTLNKSMSETELELQIIEATPGPRDTLDSQQFQRSISKTDRESHGSANANASLNLDQNGHTDSGFILEPNSSVRREGGSEECLSKNTLDNITGLTSNSNTQQQSHGKERQPKSREGNTDVQMQSRTHMEYRHVTDGVPAKLTSAEGMTLPDPYQLLIRQEAQLKELQQQVL